MGSYLVHVVPRDYHVGRLDGPMAEMRDYYTCADHECHQSVKFDCQTKQVVFLGRSSMYLQTRAFAVVNSKCWRPVGLLGTTFMSRIPQL